MEFGRTIIGRWLEMVIWVHERPCDHDDDNKYIDDDHD